MDNPKNLPIPEPKRLLDAWVEIKEELRLLNAFIDDDMLPYIAEITGITGITKASDYYMISYDPRYDPADIRVAIVWMCEHKKEVMENVVPTSGVHGHRLLDPRKPFTIEVDLSHVYPQWAKVPELSTAKWSGIWTSTKPQLSSD